jgi:hypothetical protein
VRRPKFNWVAGGDADGWKGSSIHDQQPRVGCWASVLCACILLTPSEQPRPVAIMLSHMVKEHQAKQAASHVREICEVNRKEALAATETFVNMTTNSVSEEVGQVYAAQKKLEKEVKGLQTNTAHFGKQTMQWLEMIREFNGSLTVPHRLPVPLLSQHTRRPGPL